MSEWNGARERAPMQWSPDSSRLWFAYASGVMPLNTVQPGKGAETRIVADGFVPNLAAAMPEAEVLGATILEGLVAVAVLDARDSHVRWMRIETEDGPLLQAPTGHFTTEAEGFEGWTYNPGHDADPEDLGPYIERLFDPKRVRASQAGVRLVPAD